MKSAALPVLLLILTLSSACAKRTNVASRAPRAPSPAVAVKIGTVETGIASWYGEPYHGRQAASGEIFDMHRWTAAHRTLPFHTWVEVKNLHNGKIVQVRITDRGPFVGDRLIDLSRAAAEKIDMIGPGTTRVRLTTIQSPADTSQLPQFAVQVAAFRDQSKAIQLRDQLRRKHSPVDVAAALETSGVWRVMVGNEPNPYRAALLASSLRQDFPDALVVHLDIVK